MDSLFFSFPQENHSSWFIRFSSAVCLLICPMEGTSLGIGTIVWKIGWCSFQIFLMLIFFLWLITYTFSVCGGQGVSLWRDKRGERNSGNLAKPFFDQLVILTYWQRQYETNTRKIVKWKYWEFCLLGLFRSLWAYLELFGSFGGVSNMKRIPASIGK